MTPTLSRITVGLMLFIGMAGITVANNVQVTNVELIGQNTTAGADHPANFTMIQFDVDWENSWRASVPSSWDAAWVFAKFRVGSADYLSAPGATNSGTTVTVQSTEGLRTGMPVFVHSGSGSFAAGTVITGITSATTFTISATPTGNLGGSAVIRAERIWEHCWLHQSGHVKGSMGATGSLQVGLQEESAAFHVSNNPAMGVYIYRAADGSGAFSTAGARLRWNYGAQGIKDKDLVELKVFAVEMVYVPQGSFQVDTALYQSNTVLLLDGDGSNGAQNNTFIDGSSNNFTVSRFGNTTQGTFTPFCNTGGSGYFDGNGDYLTSASSDFAFGTGDFTVELWAYAAAAHINYRALVTSRPNNSGYADAFHLGVRANGVLLLYSNVFHIQSSANAMPVGQWCHIALVRSSGIATIYVNGTSVATGSFTNNVTRTLLGIGDFPVTQSEPFNGYIADLRISKGTALYTGNFTPPAAPLTAVSGTSLLLKFENGPLDDSWRRHNIETVGNAQISTAESKFGGASMAFDGSGDVLAIADDNALDMGNNPFTWECWVYANSAQSGVWRAIYSKRNSTGWYNGPILYINTGNRLVLYGTFNNSSWGINNLTASTTLPLDSWVHVAVTWDGSTYRIFQSGTQVASLASSTPLAVNASNLYIGGEVGAAYALNGYIDDFRITKGVARYTANFTPPAAPFVASPSASGYDISSENQLTLGGTATGNLRYPVPGTAVADDFNASTTQTLPAAYPKGYNGFYMMKYEVSQERWIDFFNTLSSLQKPALDITGANGKNSNGMAFRNNISWTTGDATLNGGTHGNVACNYLSWVDAMAYTDWIGMRPMTELEYEKAARGQGSVRTGEGPSGRACNGLPKLTAVSGINNNGASNELPVNSSANAVFDNKTAGPLRTGVLATATSSREASGAGFWGAMELGGNVTEQVVTMGNSTGRSFTGAHGNGQLTAIGYADVSTWPGYVTSAVTGATGSGRRGGSWEDIGDRLRISDRMEANSAVATRDRKTGYRAVRTLPATPAQ